MSKRMTEAEFLALPPEAATAEYQRMLTVGDYGIAETYAQSYFNTHKTPVSAKPAAAAGSVNPLEEVRMPNMSRALAWVLVAAGVMTLAAAFGYDTSVSITPHPELGSYGISFPDKVNNMGKLNIQLMMCMVGCTLTLCGAMGVWRRPEKPA